MQEAIQQLNDKIKEEEQLKGDKLRDVCLIERKKYCNFINYILPVISTGIDYHQEGMKMKNLESGWKSMASSQNQLPDSIDALVNTQQNRTFVQVSNEPGMGNSSSSSSSNSFNSAPPPPPSMNRMNSSNSFNNGPPPPPPPSSGGSFGAPPPPPPPMMGGPPPPPPPMMNSGPPPPPPPMGSFGKKANKPTCTALYDYVGEVDEDLSFYAGDVITIMKDDDGSGWIEGELNGQVGIFPSSYVEMN